VTEGQVCRSSRLRREKDEKQERNIRRKKDKKVEIKKGIYREKKDLISL
jgi:hypothetical protein